MTLKRKHEMGSGGNCVCPKCDDMARPSTRCPFYEKRCPECAVKMVRGGSEHHLLIKERKRKG